MLFKQGQISKILGCSAATEAKWFDAINATCSKYDITTKLRLAAFIAQIGHESGRLKTVEENLNYSADGLKNTFKKYFDEADAAIFARKPQQIANRVYASRMGNGSESSGEGWKYRGRGLIQCTGKSTYSEAGKAIGVDCVSNPDVLTSPQYAAMSAGWFWSSRSLNDYADRKDIVGITKRINGGTNGLAERTALYERAIIVLSDLDPDDGKPKPAVPPDNTAPITTKKSPGAVNSNINEPQSAASVYPWNAVRESRSGHVIEIDDTPGNERLSTTHRTGSYWEMNSVGTFVQKSVLDSYRISKNDTYDYSGGNYVNQVDGQSYRSSTGNMILKSVAGLFIEAPRVQINAGLVAASNEISAPTMNAEVFVGPFADVLAKESMLAWDIGHGGGGGSAPPMIGGAIGFSNSSVVDSLRTNELSKKAPNGASITTNGVDPNSTLTNVAVAVAASAALSGVQNALSNSGTISPLAEKAINGAAADAAKASDAAGLVMLKHVAFDKPTLLSQSTVDNLPDPKLYQNNFHTIVDENGVGQLYMSDGNAWGQIKGTLSDAGLDQVMITIDGKLAMSAADYAAGLAAEAITRSAEILAESTARASVLANEALARQAVYDAVVTESKTRADGLLAEAMARDQAIFAETTSRIQENTMITQSINALTARVGDSEAAIVSEATARTDYQSATASTINGLATRIGASESAIITEQTTRSSAVDALSTRIDTVFATTNSNSAAISSEIITRTDADTALSSRIDTLVVKVDTNTAAITNESSVRADADSANAALITNLTSIVNDNVAAISTESTTRASADSALSSRIDSLVSSVNTNTASIQSESTTRASAIDALSNTVMTLTAQSGDNATAIQTEQTSRADADGALSTRIDTLTATVDNNTSSISSEQTTRANADSALSSRIDVVSASANAGFDAIKTWNFDSSTESWTATGATASNVAGTLQVVSSSTDPILISPAAVNIDGSKYKLIRARVKRLAGSGWDGNLYYTTAAHTTFSGSYYDSLANPNLAVGQWTTLEWDMSSLTAGGTDWSTSTITQFRIDLGSTAADQFQIDWISIGRPLPGASSADLVTLKQAIVGGDGTVVTDLTSLGTTVGGHTSTISTMSQSIDGIGAKYSVKVDNNGYISGFGLISTANNGTPTSDFTILADKFSIVKPSLNGGAPVVPFTVDTTTSPATITMNGLVRVKSLNIDASIGGGNLTRNSSFELDTDNDGIADQFTIYNNAGAAQPTTASRGTGRTGTGYSQVITWVNANTSTKGILGPMCSTGWVANRKYILSFYAKTTNMATLVAMGLMWNNAPASVVALSNPTLSTSWQRYAFQLTWGATVEASGNAFITVAAGSGGTGGNLHFDDVMVQEGEVLTEYASNSDILSSSITYDKLNISSLSSITANIGLLRTATTGQRTEIDNNGVRVYDTAGTLRVRLGVW